MVKELNQLVVELESSENKDDQKLAASLCYFNWTLANAVINAYMRRCMLISMT
jgi:hypothetical protein